ncbi:hypothetical protein [uncultured Roseovarius sp.]|uniref:hypothetical protein n=1 Tax=uncultured Roseovarius sp. TaxID=293344 RepID=UPI0025978926|nr:hypothetical protein [uncultured Roseovarius sp.]
MAQEFKGLNEGVIDDQDYLSFTDAEVSDEGVLSGFFRMEKCPTTFGPPHLSLSNASSKSVIFAVSRNKNISNFSSLLGHSGSINSARIYSFPDYPGALLAQVGFAELSDKGLYYRTKIHGSTKGLPTKCVSIDPYEQSFHLAEDGTLNLRTQTRIHAEDGTIIRSVITGQFSFKGMTNMPKRFFAKYEPVFRVDGNTTEISMPVSLNVESML